MMRAGKAMLRIVCFGDSNTWGYDPYHEDRYPLDQIWPSLLKEDDRTIVNAGECGRCACGSLPALQSVMTDSCDTLIIQLGVNDLRAGYSVDETVVSVRILAEYALKHSSHVILIAPLHVRPQAIESWGFSESGPEDSDVLTEKMHGMAEEMHCLFVDPNDFTDAADLPSDGIHLTLEGHELLAMHLKALLDQLS